MTLDEFFAHLWKDYTAIAPGVQEIHDAVRARERRVVNDHVAFRTYDDSPIRLEALEPHILALGYRRFAPYEFPGKKLRAFGYVHDRDDAPRVFLSEIKTKELTPFAQQTIRGVVDQIDAARVAKPEVLWSGRLWKPVALDVYEKLYAESEYAAWLAVWGLRANHFTISVNHLETFKSLEELLDFVEKLGYPLNESGGRVKGTPDVLLEQGSTNASEVDVEFAGGKKSKIPSCYYEFARRYPDPRTGRVYDGFVAASADKIFESTNRR